MVEKYNKKGAVSYVSRAVCRKQNAGNLKEKTATGCKNLL